MEQMNLQGGSGFSKQQHLMLTWVIAKAISRFKGEGVSRLPWLDFGFSYAANSG
jgi:hypothetical protein